MQKSNVLYHILPCTLTEHSIKINPEILVNIYQSKILCSVNIIITKLDDYSWNVFINQNSICIKKKISRML